MVRVSAAKNLSLFGGVDAEPDELSGRRIGKAWIPPVHRPTKAVPESLLRPIRADIARQVTNCASHVVDALRPRLGKPYVNRHGFVLYNDDCRKVMSALSEAKISVELTVTSPPYNIGKEYESRVPIGEYVKWAQSWLEDVWSITSGTGAFWLNLGYVPLSGKGRAVPLSYLLWDKTQFFFQQEIVWNYGAGVTSKRMFCPRNEKWLFFSKDPEEYIFNLDLVRDPNVKYPNQKKNGKFRCNPLGKNPSDVWAIPKVTTGKDRSSRERSGHPAQFPLELVDRIVKVSTIPGQVVIDPFCGSGSAGIAAIGNGCVFLGAEIRADYCDIAAARLDSYLKLRATVEAQPTLLSQGAS